ncbi:unnamed protein product [Notodromas monacha]|uniref:E3 ubiquitin-protein ligase listerin n=1 Tax=Notodromas monacha TaxID=399045 RepID=A0A7R9BEE1_9CRUS|nr:unnamed protein product [Notodromas monacha]CAG0913267.1 unnamed protein product [Notodromas monacha]
MGKGKQVAQRTKGNVKASSSGRAAEVLGASTGVIGFEALSADSAEAGDNGMDAEWKLACKKLSKKDVVTRLKGLQEILNLMPDALEEALLAFLNVWPKYFGRCALDNDKKLRETAHRVHEKLVSRLKKRIAPQLKNLMGPWILGICDQWNNAQTAASESFVAAFPPHKQREAVVFCSKESFKYLRENLFAPVDASQSGSSADENDAQWEYNVVSSLRGFAWMSKMIFSEDDTGLNSENFEPVLQSYQELFRDPAFWELPKRKKHPSIIGTWFSLMHLLLSHDLCKLTLDEAQISRLLKSTINALDSDDPGIVHAVWACLVHFITIYEKWTDCGNPESVVVPKFLSFLRNGGRGSCSSVYRYVPQMFSVLRKFVKDEQKFVSEYLQNLRKGLFCQRVALSPVDTRTVCRAFFETVVALRLDTTSIPTVATETVVLIEESICEARSENAASAVAAELSKVLRVEDSSQVWEPLRLVFGRVAREGPPKAELLGDILPFCTPPDCFPVMLALLNVKDVSDESWTIFFQALKEKKAPFLLEATQSLISLHKRSKCSALVLQDSRFHTLLMEIIQEIITEAKTISSRPSESTVSCDTESAGEDTISELDTRKLKIIETVLGSRGTSVFPTEVTEKLVQKLSSGIADLASEGNVEVLIQFASWLSLKVSPNLISVLRKDGRSVAEDIAMSVSFLGLDSNRLLSDPNDGKKVFMAVEGTIEAILNCETARDGFVTRLLSRLEASMEILREKSFSHRRAINSLVDIAFIVTKHLPTNERRTEFAYNLVEICGERMDLESFCCDCVAFSWVDSHGLPFYSEKLIQKPELLKMPVASAFVLGYLKQVTERTTAEEHDSETIIVSWKELGVACEDQLTKVIAVSWVALQYVNSLSYLWRLTAPVNWLKELNDLAKSMKNDCAAILADVFLSNEVKLLAFEKVITMAMEPGHWLVNGLASLSLGAVQDQANDDAVAKLCVMAAEVMKKLRLNAIPTAELSSVISAPFRHVIAGLILSPEERILGLKNSLRFEVNTVDIQLDFFAEHVASGATFYGGKDSPLDKDTAIMVLEKLTEVWDKIMPRNNRRSLTRNSTFEEIKCHFALCTSMEKIVCQWTTWDLELESVFQKVFLITARWMAELNSYFTADTWENIGKNELWLIIFGTEVYKLVWKLTETMQHQFDNVKSILSETPGFISRVFCKVWSETADTYYAVIYPAFLKLAATIPQHGSQREEVVDLVDGLRDAYVGAICGAVGVMPLRYLERNSVFLDGPEGPMKFSRELMPLLVSSNHCVQETAFSLLNKYMSWLACNVSHIPAVQSTVGLDVEYEGDPPVFKHPPTELLETMRSTREVVDAMLMDVRVGDGVCLVQPFTDSYTYARGYLLSWNLWMNLWSKVPEVVKESFMEGIQFGSTVYPCSLLQHKEFEKLGNNLFRLMPPTAEFSDACWKANVRACAETSRDDVGSMVRTPMPPFDVVVSVLPKSDTIAHCACRTYLCALSEFPVFMRQWFMGLSNASIQNEVSQFTTRHISPLIWSKELKIIQKEAKRLQKESKKATETGAGAAGDSSIRARETVREIVVVHTVDENLLELVLTVPANFPLTPVQVDASKRFGVSKQVWSRWVMELSMHLTHRRASILESIDIWKKNVGKRFEGVEECYICYNILHGTTNELPKKACRTCKKKFHSGCLVSLYESYDFAS